MRKKIFTLLLFIASSQYAIAQCGENLIQARDAYDAGRLEEVSGYLNECLSKTGSAGFTREQKIEAYRLLTLTYLYLDDPYGAEQSFLNLLEEDPEYRIQPTDPVELTYLSNRFISSPIVSFYAKVGPNLSHATILHYNTMSAEGNTPEYSINFGVQIAGAMELHFNKMIGVNFEAELSYKSIHKYNEHFNGGIKNDIERGLFSASLPITLRFTYPGTTLYPYAYAGYKPSLTIISFYNESSDYFSGIDKNLTGTLGPQTTQFWHSAIFGAGIKRRFGYRYILAEVRYNLGMTNMTNRKNIFAFGDDNNNRIKSFTGLDTEDDYRWNSFEISFGYVWPLYYPREKNTATIQTVIKNIFGKRTKKDE